MNRLQQLSPSSQQPPQVPGCSQSGRTLLGSGGGGDGGVCAPMPGAGPGAGGTPGDAAAARRWGPVGPPSAGRFRSSPSSAAPRSEHSSAYPASRPSLAGSPPPRARAKLTTREFIMAKRPCLRVLEVGAASESLRNPLCKTRRYATRVTASDLFRPVVSSRVVVLSAGFPDRFDLASRSASRSAILTKVQCQSAFAICNRIVQITTGRDSRGRAGCSERTAITSHLSVDAFVPKATDVPARPSAR